MNNVALAWAGGFFEGEGNFSVCRDKARPNSYRTCMQVSSVDKVSLERLQKAVGGKIYGAYHRKRVHKPVWVWNVTASEQEDVATKLLPYLEAKKERAQLFIQARRIISARRGKHQGNQYSGIVYPPLPVMLDEIYNRVKKLNKRGVD